MKYVSTRGKAPVLGFEEVMLSGLARDGGLYLPGRWPALAPAAIAGLAGLSYGEAAYHVIAPFVGKEIPAKELKALIGETYRGFGHTAVAPLVQIAPSLWVLELFHGPTLAFKDFALQLLGRLMERALEQRNARVTIVGATSGDTGSAAIEAFRGRERADIFILHPKGRTSEVQRRQMTTAVEDNVHNIAIEGTFDDCQAIVKALFNDHGLRDRLALAGVNSINWARICGQIVYYMTAAVALGAPGRPVSFAVPTGNFGDILAGYAARAMGLDIADLVIATNVNDILYRLLTTGRCEPRPVMPSSSPSMDIQVSSNFERLLFDLADRDATRVRALLEGSNAKGAYALSPVEFATLCAIFKAGRADEAETRETIARVHAETGYLLDPHTAVGVAAAQAVERDPAIPMVVLATAHPAKFPDIVEQATGCRPELPERLRWQATAKERYAVLPNDTGEVARFIAARARASSQSAGARP